MSRQFPSFPMDPVVTRADVDLRATHLQETNDQTVMGRHTYAVSAYRSFLLKLFIPSDWAQTPPQIANNPCSRRKMAFSSPTSLWPIASVKRFNISMGRAHEVDQFFIWRATSRLTCLKWTNCPFITLNGAVYSADGKTEVFVDCMEAQFCSPRRLPHTAEVENFPSDDFSRPQ